MEKIILLACAILLLIFIGILIRNCFRPYPYFGTSRPIRKIYNQPEHMIEASTAIEQQRSGRHLPDDQDYGAQYDLTEQHPAPIHLREGPPSRHRANRCRGLGTAQDSRIHIRSSSYSIRRRSHRMS